MITLHIRAKKIFQVAGEGQDRPKDEVLAIEAETREGRTGGLQGVAPKGPDSPVLPGGG